MSEKVTILAPMPIDEGRGILSTGTRPPVCARFTIGEVDIIDQAAQKLGVTRAHFIRWCSYRVALKVIGDDHGVHVSQASS